MFLQYHKALIFSTFYTNFVIYNFNFTTETISFSCIFASNFNLASPYAF